MPRSMKAETPCTSTKDWLWAHWATKQPPDFKRYSGYTGKWLLFSPCEMVAGRWETIRDATKLGGLGLGAKVSTDCRVGMPRHVICVYTYDWRDLGDVQQVGRALAEMGVIQTATLWYKTDEQTLAGVYHESGAVSLYRMVPPYADLELYKGLWRFAETNPSAASIIADWIGATGTPVNSG